MPCSCWSPPSPSGSSPIPTRSTPRAHSEVTVREQLAALKDPTVWRYSQYYSIVFGGYVALSLWMTKYYISEYGFDIQLAALLAAGFSIPGRRAARDRRLVLRQVRRAYRHLVGAVDRAGLPVLPVLPADRFHHPDRDRPQDLSSRAQSDGVHHPHVHHGHRLRDRQGLGVQVHLRRLSAQHRRDLRHRRASPAAWAASSCRSCSARWWT